MSGTLACRPRNHSPGGCVGLFLSDEENDKRLRPWYQLFALGRVDAEEFLAQKQALAIELMHRLIARRGFDLDPKTEDKAL